MCLLRGLIITPKPTKDTLWIYFAHLLQKRTAAIHYRRLTRDVINDTEQVNEKQASASERLSATPPIRLSCLWILSDSATGAERLQHRRQRGQERAYIVLLSFSSFIYLILAK